MNKLLRQQIRKFRLDIKAGCGRRPPMESVINLIQKLFPAQVNTPKKQRKIFFGFPEVLSSGYGEMSDDASIKVLGIMKDIPLHVGLRIDGSVPNRCAFFSGTGH